MLDSGLDRALKNSKKMLAEMITQDDVDWDKVEDMVKKVRKHDERIKKVK